MSLLNLWGRTEVASDYEYWPRMVHTIHGCEAEVISKFRA